MAVVDLIIPVYEEGDNIERVLRRVESAVPLRKRVLIVYDHEEDTTIPVVRRLQEELSDVELVRNAHGRGVLNAIRTGFESSTGEVSIVTMGDLSDDVEKIPEMVRLIKEEGFDVVCASRYVPGGAQIGGPRLKGFLSRTAGVSLHLLTGIPTHDITNSFRAYRTSVVQGIEIASRGGFEVSMELTVKVWARGHRVTEIPAIWRDRTEGESRFRMWKWIPQYLRWYVYALRNRPRPTLGDRPPP
ncbi:MAG: glycosyltransferase [Thermoanaerobaculia bacterium]|nr:glycosyltransferase [Thermoanaerobaculia bacterium]